MIEHPTTISQNIRFTLIHGSRTPEELPPEQILGPLTTYAENHPNRLRLKLLVDTDDGSPSMTSLPLEVGRVSEEHVKRILGSPEPTRWQKWFGRKDTRSSIPSKTLFLVCGPEQYAFLVGPYSFTAERSCIGWLLRCQGHTDEIFRKDQRLEFWVGLGSHPSRFGNYDILFNNHQWPTPPDSYSELHNLPTETLSSPKWNKFILSPNVPLVNNKSTFNFSQLYRLTILGWTLIK